MNIIAHYLNACILYKKGYNTVVGRLRVDDTWKVWVGGPESINQFEPLSSFSFTRIPPPPPPPANLGGFFIYLSSTETPRESNQLKSEGELRHQKISVEEFCDVLFQDK